MKNFIIWIFSISLTIFLAIGIVIVAVQFIGVASLNGILTKGIYEALKLWAIRASIVTAFSGFIMSYVNKPTKKC